MEEINQIEFQKMLHCGIISETYVRECVRKMKVNEMLKIHTYKITHSPKDGYWRTYVKDSSKATGCRLIKKISEEKLYDELLNYYNNPKCKYTFYDAYVTWRKIQDQLVSDNSVSRYNSDYIRFFQNTKFEKMIISEISADDIKVFFHDRIVNLKLRKSAFKKLYEYVNNTFSKAFREKQISENPMSYFVCKQFYKYCVEVTKPIEDQIFSPEEQNMIVKLLHEQYIIKPDYMPNYAVELAYLTGMRVGEISALKWDCINWQDGYFIIDKSEKFNSLKKEYFIDQTKNKQVRIFPIDNQIKKLLLKIKSRQSEYNLNSEWVFANEDGRIHASVISSCIKNKCKMLGIHQRGIHSFRKTLNSNMRCNGVSEIVASSLLGHSPKVNRDYYTFDVSTMKEKTDIIRKVHGF